MDITSIIKAVLTTRDDLPGRQMNDLQPGDRLIGRVLRVESDGRVLMDLGGNRAMAKTGFPVHAGQTLQLQVVENGALLHLQVDPKSMGNKASVPLPKADFQQVLKPSHQERLVDIARQLTTPSTRAQSQSGLPDGVKDALARIMTLFEPAPLDAGPQKVSPWIKHAVEDRGLLFEKKMADEATLDSAANTKGEDKTSPLSRVRAIITRDVKSQMILLRQYLQAASGQTSVLERMDAKSITFLRRSVDQLLGHIDSQQERAVARWADGETQQVFVHTLALPDQRAPAHLKIYYPERARRSGHAGPHRIALLLDMDQLGPVRVDLEMRERMLTITFYVQHQKARNCFEPEIKTVSDSLSGYFEHVSVDLYISREKIDAFETEDAKGAGIGRIDLNA